MAPQCSRGPGARRANPQQGLSGLGVVFFGLLAFALLAAICANAGQALGCWLALRLLRLPAATSTALWTVGFAVVAFVGLGPAYVGLLWAIAAQLFEAPTLLQYAFHAAWVVLLLGLPAPLAVLVRRRTAG